MIDFRDRIRPNWRDILQRILEQARTQGVKGVVAFDLDSTLLDNRPRQARIVREFGQARGVPALQATTAEDLDSGWDLRGAFVRRGVPTAQLQSIYSDFKPFWEERFFTSDYCVDDVAVKGAAGYLASLASTGVHICYLTGRHEGMRPGTEIAMRREGLPSPGRQVGLIMKPRQELDDDEFKRAAHADLNNIGELIAAFDNEPIHVNDYRTRFPKASIIHLATDHSGRSSELMDGVESIPHF